MMMHFLIDVLDIHNGHLLALKLTSNSTQRKLLFLTVKTKFRYFTHRLHSSAVIILHSRTDCVLFKNAFTDRLSGKIL